MWQTKTFKFKTLEQAPAAKKKLEKWLKQREGRIQYTEIFINNGYGVEWRPLKIIKM